MQAQDQNDNDIREVNSQIFLCLGYRKSLTVPLHANSKPEDDEAQLICEFLRSVEVTA